MRVQLTDDGWSEYLHWSRAAPSVHRRLNELIDDVPRPPFAGLAKLEALRANLLGWWSRRITSEHPLVYG